MKAYEITYEIGWNSNNTVVVIATSLFSALNKFEKANNMPRHFITSAKLINDEVIQ